MLYNICTVIIAVGSIKLLLRLLVIDFHYFYLVIFLLWFFISSIVIRSKIQHDFYSLGFILLSENSFLSRYLVLIKTY